MKIIFLDDMETRHAMFDLKDDKRNEIIHVRTVEETIEAVKKNPKADLLFLDHDLGGWDDENYARDPGEKGTGSEVAKKLVDLPEELLPKKIILHTHNPSGAQFMYQTLKFTDVPMEWRPFGNSIEDLLSGRIITPLGEDQ